MSVFIGLVGMVGFVVCLALLIVAFVRKKSEKKSVIGQVVCFVLFIIGIAMSSPISVPPTGESKDTAPIVAEGSAKTLDASEPVSAPPSEASPSTAAPTLAEPKTKTPSTPATQSDQEEQIVATPSSKLEQERLLITPAQNPEELALIVEQAIKNTPGVTECFIMTYDEVNGVVIAAETKMSDASQIWQVAYAGILTGYLNKGNVPVVRMDVNISTPDAIGYSLQVFVGRDHLDENMLETLKNTTWQEFKNWLTANSQTSEVFLANDAHADLRIQGPLSVDKEAEFARLKAIETQFSLWDGAHYNLVDTVKEQLHDPASFRHVETVYWDMQDYIVVRMTFRGKNQLGGVVTNIVKAWIDLSGNIQKWEWH